MGEVRHMTETGETLTLEGVVETVIFHNEENGYTVLRLEQADGSGVTAVGCMPGIAPGETVSLTGSWMRHPSFGEQFKAETAERSMPTDVRAIYDYLAARTIRGIGPRLARRIVDAFGEDTFRVLEEEPARLARRVKGITPQRAEEISAEFVQKNGLRRLMEFLGGHGLSVRLATDLWRRYGELAQEILRANPYLLAQEDFGVAFPQADALAVALGVAADDPQRLEAGLLYELSHNLGNGHTFLPRRKLIPATAQLLGVDGAALEQSLDGLADKGQLFCERVAGEEACYLASLYLAETHVAGRLEEMSREEYLPPKGLDGLIARIEEEQGLTYAPQQRAAVERAARRQVMLLTGGPGTGKTTSLRGILGLFEAMGLDTALAAPTGRAAKRLGELCGQEASTIHRLLEAGCDQASGQLVFQRDESQPLKADAVIVDETSMVDLPLMDALLSALRGDARLILVGDPDQLPSVGPGSLLSDLLRSRRLPTVELTEIFRQAQESAIVMNAHRVNRGELPDLANRSRDFFFLRRREGARAVETIVELCQRRLPDRMGIPADQIQVLSPTRKYATGTANLNRALQAALNPPGPDKHERRYGDVIFREGDRVMQVRNNYDLMWRQRDGIQSGMGVFNGDIGLIREIDPKGETLTVDFDGRLVEYTPDLLGELEPAFAITVHKAQGSEYRAVVLAVLDGAPMLMSRGVLYTAITRARELLVAVGDEQVVARMAANDRQTRRYSGLRARLAAGTGAEQRKLP